MTWPPDPEPDPSAVLNGALNDTRNGAHDQALAKFLWFHHHALRHKPSLYGVRLSFALSYWTELAAVFPPAAVALVRTRDETEAAFNRMDTTARGGRAGYELFHDLASLNEYLDDRARTANLFARTAMDDLAAAASFYRLAEDSLIVAGRPDVCGPFLDVSARLRRAAEVHEDASARSSETGGETQSTTAGPELLCAGRRDPGRTSRAQRPGRGGAGRLLARVVRS